MAHSESTPGTTERRAIAEGQKPPTVSPPGIHYTTTVDARAFIYVDTCVFIAYNTTFEKRVLHTLRFSDTLSLTTQRPLYLEDSMLSHGTISIADLISEKFSEDPVSMYIVHPKLGYVYDPLEHSHLVKFYQEMKDLCASLPVMPHKAGFWCMLPAPEGRPVTLPRVMSITRDPTDAAKSMPVVLNGDWISSIM